MEFKMKTKFSRYDVFLSGDRENIITNSGKYPRNILNTNIIILSKFNAIYK